MNKPNNTQRTYFPRTQLKEKSNHLYSNFFRYAYIEENKNKKKLKLILKPIMKEGNINREIPSNVVKYRDILKKSINTCYTIRYRAEKLIIGSALSSYTGDAMTTLHPIYGVPYIPGSAIKGVVKQYIIHEIPDVEQEHWFKKVFGISNDNTEEDKYGQGCAIFFDSFPEKNFELAKDVQTPHFSEYYGSEGEISPTDDLSPIPFNFYMAKNTTFIIQIGFNDNIQEIPEDFKQYIMEALTEYGLGGKTSVGYGLAIETKLICD